MDINTPLTRALQTQPKDPQVAPKATPDESPMMGGTTDVELLDLWESIKHECFDTRWVFERQFQRNIWYVLGRQWIEYQSKYGGWRDKRMANWIPRPVTNKCKETVQSLRAMFTSIALSVNVRPNGSEPKNVSAAATADEMSPLLHESHHMNTAMSEFDFWLCVCGNAFLHTYMDYDPRHGMLTITAEQCMGCGTVTPSTELTGAQPVCPDCGATQFQQATDPKTGEPLQTQQPKGIPATMVLSPLEIAFPQSYTRFDDLPLIVRSRWRTKRYYEGHPDLKLLVPQITWQKSPQDHSLALFTSLGQANDLGITQNYVLDGSGRGSEQNEGISEYEVQMKPNDAYPDGLVFRVIGDSSPIVVRLEDEGLPGPLPYTDADGKPLFTWAHAAYEQVGGRILGSGPLDQIIQKQDQLNQLDSLVLLIINRMANPVWLEPKGAEIQKLTGMPGLVIKWNPLTVGGNAKPERIPGVSLDTGLMALREQYLRDIEELAGTFDIIKGQKPAGVEAFSALQLLVERSQARFSSVFQARGDVYKQWFKFAIELERSFGPDERTKAIMTPSRSWTFKTFKNAQLQGSVSIVVDEGSTVPKTSLGMRAAVEHGNALGMLDMKDPDQQYEGLKLFGLTRMVPQLDINIQRALQKQEAFEAWVANPQNVQMFVQLVQQQQQEYQLALQQVELQQQAQLKMAVDPATPMPQPIQPPPPPPPILDSTPLRWQPWYNAQIHMQEFLKWANDDNIAELMTQIPIVQQLLVQHQQDIRMAILPPIQPVDVPKITFTFNGADLADPQVRQAFDQAEKLSAPPPGVGAPVGNKNPLPPPQAGGAGRAMKASNDNSAPDAGNKPQGGGGKQSTPGPNERKGGV